jgi:hypothetical protein
MAEDWVWHLQGSFGCYIDHNCHAAAECVLDGSPAQRLFVSSVLHLSPRGPPRTQPHRTATPRSTISTCISPHATNASWTHQRERLATTHHREVIEAALSRRHGGKRHPPNRHCFHQRQRGGH